MKKFIALLLALMMALVCVSALAADDDPVTNPDAVTEPDIAKGINNPAASAAETTFTLTKNYTVTGTNAVNPSDLIKFTVGNAGFENAGTVAPNSIPMISIVYPEDAEGYAVSQGATSATITVKLPQYTVPGVYTYTISEVDTNVAGVTYLAVPLNVKITVAYDETGTEPKLIVAGIAVREGTNTTKTDKFENKYDSGTLEISKQVTGNMGDKAKVWDFTVTLTAPTGDTDNAPITITGTYTSVKENNTAVPTTGIAAGWTGTKTLKVQLTDAQDIKFANLPAGVTYTVVEDAASENPAEANADGYKTTTTFSDTEKKIAAADEDTVTFVNNKQVDIDTGVTLDSAVYMLIMALALAGFVALKVRRREDY